MSTHTGMKIFKFGGTSLESAERMKALLGILDNHDNIVIVLSAVAGTTNALVELNNCRKNNAFNKITDIIEELKKHYTQYINHLHDEEKIKQQSKQFIQSKFNEINKILKKDSFLEEDEKTILAQGELISTNLFFNLTKEYNINSKLLSSLDFIRLGQNNEPDIEYISKTLPKHISNKNVKYYITQGYICLNHSGAVDNLQRGGSDYTATLIGAAIKAEQVQIWTDIDGIRNGDPRIVENTSPLRELSYDEAAELAYFGAKILHPFCVFPSQKYDVPILLKFTMDPSAEGTLISSKKNKNKIKSVAAKSGITALRITSSRMLMSYGYVEKIFSIFSKYKTPIDMIATSETSVSMTIDNNKGLEKIIEELEHFGTIDIYENNSIICVVGDFAMNQNGIALKVLKAIEEYPIRMISYGGSQNNISLLVEAKNKNDVLRALHKNLLVNQ